MNLGKHIGEIVSLNKNAINALSLRISALSGPNVSAYQHKLKKTATVSSGELANLEAELKELKAIRPDRIFLDYVLPILKDRFPELSFKIHYMAKNERKGSLILIHNGIEFLEFSLYDYNLRFELKTALIGQSIDFFKDLSNVDSVDDTKISGLCDANDPYYVTLNNEKLLLSIRSIDYFYLTIDNLFGFIDHMLDKVFPIFEHCYYYKNKNTGDIEFFVTKLSNGRIYAKDFKVKKYVSADYYSDRNLKRGFSNFKRCFESQISRVKNLNARDYEIVKS